MGLLNPRANKEPISESKRKHLENIRFGCIEAELEKIPFHATMLNLKKLPIKTEVCALIVDISKAELAFTLVDCQTVLTQEFAENALSSVSDAWLLRKHVISGESMINFLLIQQNNGLNFTILSPLVTLD